MPDRRRLLIIFILAAAALLLLTVSISRLELQEGKPLPESWEEQSSAGNIADLPGGETLWNILRSVYFAMLVLFPVALVYLLLSKEGRKLLLRTLLRLLPVALLLMWLFNYLRKLAAQKQVSEGGMGGFNQPPLLTPGPELDFTPSAPSWVVWATSLAVALGVVALVLLIVWIYWKKQQRPQQQPLKLLAQEAQNALDSIEAGADLRNVVVRCYFEMSQILNQTRGITRNEDMTPHEFQMRLVEKGLPGEAIDQLTQLFEEARYGQRAPGKLEEQRAVASLSAILAACKVSR